MSDKRIFSISRNDDLYDYVDDFEDIFKFTCIKGQTPEKKPDVYREDLGFDFQRECRPILEILPINRDTLELDTGDINEYCINVFIQDSALRIRKKIDTIKFSDLHLKIIKKYDLREIVDLSFTQGFIFTCAISRLNNTDKSEIIWSKSQILYSVKYEAKVNPEDSLFFITWKSFQNEKEKRNVVSYVDWKSEDISSISSEESFEVIANEDLRDQIKRTENNKNFGTFVIQLVVEKILTELIIQCLYRYNFGTDPEESSLQAKITSFFKSKGLVIEDYAKIMQDRGIESLETHHEISVIIQNSLEIGKSLENIKFGGSR